MMALAVPCPTPQGRQWACTRVDAPPWPAQAEASAQVTAQRDLIKAPHVWVLQAQAQRPGQSSRGQVQESVFVPVLAPAPGDAPTAALVLNGCLSEAAPVSLQICPLTRTGPACAGPPSAAAVHTHFALDTSGDGLLSSAEKDACMALSAISLPGGGARTGPDTASARQPCNRAAWRSVLGHITDQQLKAWSQAQERQGLHALSTPPRTLYWVDSPADWTQSVGSPSHPVLLVLSAQACAQRCPRIAPGVHIHGSVVLDSGCDDNKVRDWQGGWIEGQLVVESGLPQWRATRLWARTYARQAYTLTWPEGIDPTQVQRVNGSWSDSPP
jgi:hypothetical protein